ncbi:hypothetical protein LR48_Vigan833s000700 [Vigna angularis]|uniref:Uncharacterized protein n=1 Tax=Phaseolus angularis TaxID=3914 RepID=A0A0L9TH38_PHAAN|nr:hypothetical protein LR48_Vigan833s000700 [Vigna angularis]
MVVDQIHPNCIASKWEKLFLLLRHEGEMMHYRDVGFEISRGGRTWKRWRDSMKWFLAGFASRSMEKKFLVVTTLLAFLDLQVKVARCRLMRIWVVRR